MNKKKIIVLFFSFLFVFSGWKIAAAFEIPPKPNPPRLVNDYAHMLSPGEDEALENKLVALSDSTSIQIAVVTVSSLDGDDISQVAFKIGDQWGVGGKNQDNGFVILVESAGHQVFIATGKGGEGPVTDVQAKQIIDQIIVPDFRNGDYFQGLDQATTAIMKLTHGEYVNELSHKSDDQIPWLALIVIIIIILIIFSRINRGGGGVINRRGSFFPPWWMWGGGLGGGGFRGGGFGGGGGGFGGGGFGGFGGGSFGGGGAGGRW